MSVFVCACPQVLGLSGPSSTCPVAPPTPPPWLCSLWMRGPPCRGWTWSCRGQDTGFLSTRRDLPQVRGLLDIKKRVFSVDWRASISHFHIRLVKYFLGQHILVYLKLQPVILRPSSFFSLGRYMADCWGGPSLWFWIKKKRKSKASWTSGSLPLGTVVRLPGKRKISLQ